MTQILTDWLLVCVLATGCGFPAATAFSQTGRAKNAPVQTDELTLEPGVPITREIKEQEVHSYRITLAAGQYLRATIAPRGRAVHTVLDGPDGNRLTEAPSPRGARGTKRVSVVAEMPGDYWLRIAGLTLEWSPTSYTVKIEELRPAEPRDSMRVAAERAFAKGEMVHVKWTPDTLPEAIEHYQVAHDLWQTLGDTKGQGEALLHTGIAHTWINDMGKAVDSLTQAVHLLCLVEDRRDCADALSWFGITYQLMDEPQKALACNLQALPLFREVGDHSGAATTLVHVGNIYQALGEPQASLDYYKAALQFYRSQETRYSEAVTLVNLGGSYHLMGEPQKALEHYQQALTLMRALKQPHWIARILCNIGRVYASLGQWPKAIESYNQAFTQKPDRRWEGQTLSDLGEATAALGEAEKALEYYAQALSIHRAVWNLSAEAETLHGMARIERDRGNLDEAHARIGAALDIIESQRVKVASQELRASYLASVRRYYEFYTDLLMRMHKREPTAGHNAAAIQSSERARARSLLDTLAEARKDIHQGADPQLLERARRMQQQLNAKSERLTRLLGGKHSEEEADRVEKEVRALLTEYEQVQTQIRLSSPRYAALTQPAPLSLKEIQAQVLDDDTLLLEYALGDERSYLWAVTRDSMTSVELPRRRQIEAAAQQFYRLIRASHRTGAKAQTDIAALSLSKMLLGPVAGQLGKKRVVIVADGALQYVPFAALPAPGLRPPNRLRLALDCGLRNQESEIRNPKSEIGCPLIAHHEIVNLPSASVLAVLRRELAERQPASKAVAVIADPVFAPNDERVKNGIRGSGLGVRGKAPSPTVSSQTPNSQSRITNHELRTPNSQSQNSESRTSDIERSAKESGVMTFDRLRFSRREAEAITSLVPERERLKALDFVANRATAMSSELNQYRILHFATHGLLNNFHPALSGLVLSLVDEKGKPQDGFLRLHEIYNLKLGAELVVLSACQTALGKDVQGEGLVGLTRGFMYAGAPRVVVSLWNVSDEATAELMKRFYRGMLADGLSPAAALRAAQVSMWKEKRWEAPYYWAAFMLQGEWR